MACWNSHQDRTLSLSGIIAIHGLDGHRLYTWIAETAQSERVMWLQEFLPSDIPHARILTYGYDADTRSSEFTSTNTIQRHAMGFMQAVERARKGVERRPIIFLAHSLGGIILKQALVLCQNQPQGRPLHGILTSTHAVLFFGTPHSGSEGVPFLQVLNQLLSVYMQTNNRVLQHLRENSEALEDIQATFTQASAGLHIVYFYEEYATPLVGGRHRVIVPHHSAVVSGDPNALGVSLFADHVNMVKFLTRETGNYQTVLYYLREEVESATGAVEKKWQRVDAQIRASP
ncbi:hypothetical protein PIIN_10557 [Serendipita indica DSM 11827]|uniref:DUF676 domain-containing protein n=1 Tax=Serendipita indica (strain DSM 11827) TaxID=1109443 RepID=G4TZ21_SERID|nr:hypothetical protein PIIN_10557 [Serendipita indica DSM 11827]